MKFRLLQFLLSVILSASAEGVLDAEETDSRILVPAPEDERISHLSWPKIVKAGNGTLVLAYSAGIGHNRGGSGLAVSLSKDGGESFSSPKLLTYFPDDDPRYGDVGNLALGAGSDGALVLLAMAFRGSEANTILGWRSEDDGETWTRTDTSMLGDNRTGSVFGHVFPVEGMGLAVCGHYRLPKGNGLWVAFSKDDGRSWGSPRTITGETLHEPVFVATGERWIGLVRQNAAHAYHQWVSLDAGTNWQFWEKAIQGDPGSVHPSPFLVIDPADPERLLALVSERGPAHRISLWEARVATLQWKRLGPVVEGGSGDWTYPWMTHLEGDQWFLVYYQGDKRSSSILGRRLTIPSGERGGAP